MLRCEVVNITISCKNPTSAKKMSSSYHIHIKNIVNDEYNHVNSHQSLPLISKAGLFTADQCKYPD